MCLEGSLRIARYSARRDPDQGEGTVTWSCTSGGAEEEKACSPFVLTFIYYASDDIPGHYGLIHFSELANRVIPLSQAQVTTRGKYNILCESIFS